MLRTKPTVVIVDDDPIVLEQVKSTLEPAGYRVITRGRALGCVALTLQDEPDLLLMDVGLPGVEGDTLVKMLMVASPKRRTRVVLYSGLRESELRRRVQDSGADGYICKTKDPKILLREVANWVAQRPKDSLAQDATDATDATAARPNGAGGNVSSDGTPALSSASSAQRAATRPQILFVDDDMMMLSAYRRLIHRENMDAEFALSGSQALKWILSSDPPDVVVCDLMMPDPGGDAVLARAMDLDARWAERFVFVTGFKDAAHRLKLATRSTVLAKPVEPAALLAAIRKSLGAFRSAELYAVAQR